MRPRCPRCNSIQTKYKSSKPLLVLLDFHKCKSCGHEFIPKPEKKKSGCLGTLVKVVVVAILLLLLIGWFFNDEASQKNSSTVTRNNISWEPEKEVERSVNVEAVPKHENKQDSIESSQNMDDTLSIKTSIRESE